MKYDELTNAIKNSEDSGWFGEYLYFKALDRLTDVRANLALLETGEHVDQIVRVFLSLWGGMRRTVERKDLDWDMLTQKLRRSQEFFQKLQGRSLLDIDLQDERIADIVMKAYGSADVKYIGATAVSKILHLLNPELFVMWDDKIRKKYKVAGSAAGYLKFLKEVKRQVEEALEEEAIRTGVSKRRIACRICAELPSRKLGRKYRRKTLAKLIDEYNWWVAHHP